MSYRVKTPWHRLVGATFIHEVRDALVKALLEEKKARKLKQTDLARAIGVDRSVIHRQLTGETDISLMRVGEIAAILGRDIRFSLSEPLGGGSANDTEKAKTTAQPANSTWRPGPPNQAIRPEKPRAVQVPN